MMEYICLTGLC